MKTTITLFFLLASLNLYSQSAWFEQNSGTTTTLYSVDFINANTGVAVGYNGRIVRTSNGGNNWNVITSPLIHTLTNVFFTDENTVYAHDIYNIAKSTNAGANWFYISQTPPVPEFLRDLFFLNSDTGYLTTTEKLMRTTDGGYTWNMIPIPVYNPPNIPLREIYFFNHNTGILTSYNYNLRTTNAGMNWMDFGQTQSTHNFTKISESSCIFFTGGVYGVLLRNYGNSSGNPWPFNEVKGASFCNSYLGLVVRSFGIPTYIHRSYDGGDSWSIIYTIQHSFHDVSFPDINNAYVVGAEGKILATRTGGLVGISPISSDIPTNYLLRQNYPNPFNPSTNIKFDIPQNDFVKIAVYDLLGKEVAVLVNEELKAGTYETQWNAESFSSGIYIVKMESNSYFSTQKMILLK